jgi:porin
MTMELATGFEVATTVLRTNSPSVEINEEKLVAEAKGGSVAAFEHLVARYDGRVFRLAQSITHNREDAEEIMQDAFVKVFRNLPQFRGDSRFYTWLVRITVNEALMRMRRHRLSEVSIDDSVETENARLPRQLEDWGSNPEQRYSEQELQSILATTIGQLTPGYRAVFQLRDVEGLSTEETAQALALSPAAVKARLQRARFRLRESLNKYFRALNGRKTMWMGLFLMAVTFLLSTFPLFAQEPRDTAGSASPEFDFASRQYLLGDWGGERRRLAEKGVTFDFHYVADLQANPTGGEKQTQAGWGRIRGTVDMDLGKLVGANGLTFHATGVWQFGVDLGAKLGTIANPTGLVSAHTTRLDSWWLQQALFHDKVFVKVGQFAGLDFYGDQQYGASYIIEPLDYALGNLFSTTYESFNPAATPAAEIRFVPTPNVYVKSAIFSGNRNPYAQDSTGFDFKIADTPVFVYEAGFLVDPPNAKGSAVAKTYPGSYEVGAAYNAGKFLDSITNRYTPGNYLIYIMANQAVYRPTPGSNRGLDLDFGFDWSPSDVNRQNSQLTAGFRYNGLIPHRDHDGLAFGVVYNKISDQFSFAGTLLGMPALGSEEAIELNYAIQVSPCVLLQPVFQYYVNVGGNSHIPNAAVFGFRTKVTF